MHHRSNLAPRARWWSRSLVKRLLHAELEASHAHQDRTLEATHRLEAALGSVAPGRELAWRDEVLAALVVLDEVTSSEINNADRPDSLLSDIALAQPHPRNRVRGVRAQYRQLRGPIEALRHELEGAGSHPGVVSA